MTVKKKMACAFFFIVIPERPQDEPGIQGKRRCGHPGFPLSRE